MLLLINTFFFLCLPLAITLGRLCLCCPEHMAPSYGSFIDSWCLVLGGVSDNHEKDTAFRGICAVISQNPADIMRVRVQAHCLFPLLRRSEKDGSKERRCGGGGVEEEESGDGAKRTLNHVVGNGKGCPIVQHHRRTCPSRLVAALSFVLRSVCFNAPLFHRRTCCCSATRSFPTSALRTN